MATYYISAGGNNTDRTTLATAPRNLTELLSYGALIDADIINVDGDAGLLVVEPDLVGELIARGSFQKNPGSTVRPTFRVDTSSEFNIHNTGTVSWSEINFDIVGNNNVVRLFLQRNTINAFTLSKIKASFSGTFNSNSHIAHFEQTQSNMTVENCVFVNPAGFVGLYMDGGVYGATNLKVINNTFYNFSGIGACLRLRNFANVEVQNNILYGSGNATAIYQSSNTGATFDYNDIYNFGTDYEADPATGSNGITTDPMFVDPGLGDLNLQSGSPAIDTGATTSATTDFDGKTRPQGSAFDMGAFEADAGFAVNFYASGNGSLTGDTTQSVEDGADASPVTAVPDTGYAFSVWSGDSTSLDNPLTVLGVTSDMDMTANFTLSNYTVNFTAGKHGDLIGDASQTVAHGGTATAVKASARKNYNFAIWGGSFASASNPLVVSNVTSDMTLNANFLKKFSRKKIFENGVSINMTMDSTNVNVAKLVSRGFIPFSPFFKR